MINFETMMMKMEDYQPNLKEMVRLARESKEFNYIRSFVDIVMHDLHTIIYNDKDLRKQLFTTQDIKFIITNKENKIMFKSEDTTTIHRTKKGQQIIYYNDAFIKVVDYLLKNVFDMDVFVCKV